MVIASKLQYSRTCFCGLVCCWPSHGSGVTTPDELEYAAARPIHAHPYFWHHLLIVAGGKTPVAKWAQSFPPMVWIGLIGYELHLVHWPAISSATILVGDTPTIATRAAIVRPSVLGAWLQYAFVEKPLRFGPHTLTKTGGLVAAVGVVAIAGTAIAAAGGKQETFDVRTDRFFTLDQCETLLRHGFVFEPVNAEDLNMLTACVVPLEEPFD